MARSSMYSANDERLKVVKLLRFEMKEKMMQNMELVCDGTKNRHRTSARPTSVIAVSAPNYFHVSEQHICVRPPPGIGQQTDDAPLPPCIHHHPSHKFSLKLPYNKKQRHYEH